MKNQEVALHSQLERLNLASDYGTENLISAPAALEAMQQAVASKVAAQTPEEKAVREAKKKEPGASLAVWKKEGSAYDNVHWQEDFTRRKFVFTASNLSESLDKAHKKGLLPSFKPGKPIKVVDLGCGPGASYIAVEALRQKLGLQPVEYWFVDFADWKLQLQAMIADAAASSTIFVKKNLQDINADWWQKSPLLYADLIVCWYVHELFKDIFTGSMLETLVAKGGTVLYGSPVGHFEPSFYSRFYSVQTTHFGECSSLGQQAIVYTGTSEPVWLPHEFMRATPCKDFKGCWLLLRSGSWSPLSSSEQEALIKHRLADARSRLVPLPFKKVATGAHLARRRASMKA